MSADAKVWLEDGESGWVAWQGIHDGDCADECHRGTLSDVLESIEHCMGGQMRWEIFIYTNGQPGLKGWTW